MTHSLVCFVVSFINFVICGTVNVRDDRLFAEDGLELCSGVGVGETTYYKKKAEFPERRTLIETPR